MILANILPPGASLYAHNVDVIYYTLMGVSVLICLLLLIVGGVFIVRYRRGSPAKRGPMPELLSREIEIGWTVATFFAFIFLFFWAAAMLVSSGPAQKGDLEIHVVAKQWMWKAEQPNGAREINEIHVPVDTPVRLVMTSQDVIHSLFLPALRLKQDVLPQRYVDMRFTADRTGTFPLLCAEYCGTEHSHMTGKLVIMTKQAYQKWLEAQPGSADVAGMGRKLFTSLGCSGCHGRAAHVRAPDLEGVYGRSVQLADGRTVQADKDYLRDSILEPRKDIVAGYEPIMPSYKNTLSDSDVLRLVAYLKSLASKEKDQ
ncbi:MAG: cytochrome c oxidase subunit II [Alphaproteobacteria bacterium]|nr:cytochrome c oxidase subunit II [Alphaproteobacteria bacterium]